MQLFLLRSSARNGSGDLFLRKADDSKFCFGLFVFADTYWMFATSPREARDMMSAWLNILAERGWTTPVNLTYATTAEDDQYTDPSVIGDETMSRASRKIGIKVLGTSTTTNNRFNVELDRGITAAWGLGSL